MSLMVGRIGAAFGLALISMPQAQVARGVECHAATGDETKLGLRDLPLATFAPQLPHAFDDVQPALHVGFRQIAAGGMDGERTAERDAGAALDEGAGLALRAKACMLQPEQHRDSEIVIELRNAD